MQNKKGVSLIVLIITILVMIIIAGVVIVNLQDKNSIIEAEKVALQGDIAKAQEALEVNFKTKEMKDSNFDKYTVNASTEAQMKMYIKKASPEIIKYLEIQKGELVLRKIYDSSTDPYVLWIKELDIAVGE